MAQFNENIKIVAPNPIDDRYLSTRTCAGSQLPYSADTEVFSTIGATVRYTGLTVLIQSGASNVEYWFKEGISDGSLIEKKYDSTIPTEDFVTGATNIGFFSGFTGIQTLTISTLNQPPLTNYLDYVGQYNSLYNWYNRGTDGAIHTGVAHDGDGIAKRGYLKSSYPVKSWVWNEYTGGSDLQGWILIDGNIANMIGTFQTGVIYYTGVSKVYTQTSWSVPDANGSSVAINNVGGSLTTGDTLTIGGPVFNYKEHNDLHLRTIKSATPAHIAVGYDESFVYLSGTSYLISGQNIGTGAKVLVEPITGETLQFRSLQGSGGTTVIQSGDNIIITASGGSGGGTYDLDSPAAITVGGISDGTELTGKTSFELWEELLVPTLNPTLTDPYVSTSLSNTGSFEVGCLLNSFDVTSQYCGGCINPQYTAACCERSCGVIGYCYESTGGQLDGYYVDGTTSHVESTNYVVSAGTQTWCTSACHCDGVQPYDSKGDPYLSPLDTGFTTTSNASITGIYAWFWGSTVSAPVVNQALFDNYITCGGGKCVASSNGTITVDNYNISGRYIWFATPSSSTDKTEWQGLNNPSNNGTIPGTLMASPVIISVNSPDGCGWTCNYDVYVSNGITSISYGMEFCN